MDKPTKMYDLSLTESLSSMHSSHIGADIARSLEISNEEAPTKTPGYFVAFRCWLASKLRNMAHILDVQTDTGSISG